MATSISTRLTQWEFMDLAAEGWWPCTGWRTGSWQHSLRLARRLTAAEVSISFHHPTAELIKIIAVILTRSVVQEVISNFSRTWIYTTCTSYAAVIAVDCCIDVLEDGRSEKVRILHCIENI